MPRLVIISSKLRNTSAIRHALQPNVNFVQYKYDNCTLEGLLGETFVHVKPLFPSHSLTLSKYWGA